MLVKTKCRSCGTLSEFSDTGVIGNGNVRLIKCENCGSVLVEDKPDELTLVKAYNALFKSGNYGGNEKRIESITQGKQKFNPMRLLLMLIIESGVRGRDMIEIGGGLGEFGYYVSKRKWTYTNYDISEVAVEATRKLNLNAHLFPMYEIPPLEINSADAIVALEVIEHIWNVQEYLTVIAQALKPGGILLITTPNYFKRGYKEAITKPGMGSPPIHINFYSKESIRQTLHSSGFSRVRFINRRFYRAKPLSYAAKIAVGLEPEPTLYVLARV